jgi:hypothetical protein
MQGCQMVYFQTKNLNLGKILEGLGMEKVAKFFGHLEYIAAIWYIFVPFGILCQEKSGNPGLRKYLKLTKVAQIFGLLSPSEMGWAIFWAVFHKLIWSP